MHSLRYNFFHQDMCKKKEMMDFGSHYFPSPVSLTQLPFNPRILLLVAVVWNYPFPMS